MFAAYKLKKGQWVPTRMRVTAFAVERLDAEGGPPCCPPSVACYVLRGSSPWASACSQALREGE